MYLSFRLIKRFCHFIFVIYFILRYLFPVNKRWGKCCLVANDKTKHSYGDFQLYVHIMRRKEGSELLILYLFCVMKIGYFFHRGQD